MRRIKYFVAASLDGYIADPDGGVDWLFHDQDYGFTPFYESVDTVLVGRATYDFGVAHGQPAFPGKTNYVFSSTLDPADHPLVSVISSDPVPFVRDLKEADGGDIWLVGGGLLFRALFEDGLVDDVIVAVHPRLLGRGIPLLPESGTSMPLKLVDVTQFDSGLVTLSYQVEP
jgi:dihydrofolate reductase